MTLEVRRIVTGHDANGKAVIKTDERLTATPELGRGCEIWSTNHMPVDNSAECDLELDSDEVAHLKAGDVVVQRGTMHAPGSTMGPRPAYSCSSCSTQT